MQHAVGVDVGVATGPVGVSPLYARVSVKVEGEFVVAGGVLGDGDVLVPGGFGGGGGD